LVVVVVVVVVDVVEFSRVTATAFYPDRESNGMGRLSMGWPMGTFSGRKGNSIHKGETSPVEAKWVKSRTSTTNAYAKRRNGAA